jgi:signal transduction histidine kinase
MKFAKYIQSHLNVKLFLAFVIIIIVFTLVLVAAVELVMPNAFEKHLQFMNTLLVGNESALAEHNINLYESFRAAIYESLEFALPISLLFAIILSVFLSREFVSPIKKLSKISYQISEGKYDQRVSIPDGLEMDEMDELKTLAINFNHMASKLEMSENQRRQLIGDVSHELRTPISLIKASMEGLIDGIITPDEDVFYQVQVEADRLTKLINDLQELNIIESRAYKLEKINSDLSQVIYQVIQNLSPLYAMKAIRLINHTKDSSFPVEIDIDRIKQVLTNILANAYQYSDRGTDVEISCEPKRGLIEVSIKDHGKGIKPEDLPHIFTRFFRADKSRSRNSGGTGIGLTVAKQLVEAHGGKIWVASEGLGKGTTISFTIPMQN